jgi:hypothetical protein
VHMHHQRHRANVLGGGSRTASTRQADGYKHTKNCPCGQRRASMFFASKCCAHVLCAG